MIPIAFIGQSCAFIALPLVLQQEMRFSPLAAAGVFIPWPLMTALIGPWAGKCADRSNPLAVACAGVAIFALGIAALATLPTDAQPWDIMWRTALCGIGYGLFQSPNNREILTSAPARHSARAAALLSAARLSGQACGVILVGLFLNQTPQPERENITTVTQVAPLLWCVCYLQISSLLLCALLQVTQRRKEKEVA